MIPKDLNVCLMKKMKVWIGLVRVDSKYTSHNTSICKLIIVKVKRKMKIILLILKNKRFHCGQIMNSAV